MGKKKEQITEDHYEIVDNGPENFQHVRLSDKSPYPGILYQYGEVQLLEEGDQLRVKFKYEIFDNPERHMVEFSPGFVDYIGEILMTNLREFLIYLNYQKGQNVV